MICETCNDTHRMELGDRVVSCTRCPLPCTHCRGDDFSSYCATTPCDCYCHEVTAPQPPSDEPLPGWNADGSIADPITALCSIVAHAGGTMTLYGQPVTEGELRAHVQAGVEIIIQGATQVATVAMWKHYLCPPEVEWSPYA